MRWERIRPAEGRRMPWKQGGGSTLELAVEPPGASLGLDLGQGHLLKLQEGEGLLTLAAGLAGASLVTVRIWPRA